jgi:hypothetical protein
MKKKKVNPHLGSDFHDFLKEEGITKAVNTLVKKEITDDLRQKIREADLPVETIKIIDDAVQRCFRFLIGKKERLILSFVEIKLLPKDLQKYFNEFSPKRESIAYKEVSSFLNIKDSPVPKNQSAYGYIISSLQHWAWNSGEKVWYGLRRGKDILIALPSRSGPISKETFYHNDLPIDAKKSDVVVELELVVKKVIKNERS